MIRIQWSTNSTIRDPDIGGDTIVMDFNEIVIDASLAETLDIGATATEHAVESGQDVTDHVHPGLRRVVLDCIVSNTPTNPSIHNDIRLSTVELPATSIFSIRQPTKIGESPRQETRNVPARRITAYAYPEIDRPREVVDALTPIILAGQDVDIIGLRLGDLEGWVITNISPVIETTDAVRFSLSAQEMRTVTINEVEAPSPRVERARPRTDAGNQAPAQPQPGLTAEQRESNLRRGLEQVMNNGLYNTVGNALGDT